MIISGKVYNVTSYIPFHPGGKNSIISSCGRDATSVFDPIHSASAHNMLASYYVGDLGSIIGGGTGSSSGSGQSQSSAQSSNSGGSGISSSAGTNSSVALPPPPPRRDESEEDDD